MQSSPALQAAGTRRDAAMQQVADNAGPEWILAALAALRRFAEVTPQFMTEDAREFATKGGLPAVHDNRAWGPVAIRAIKAGLIERVGYAPSKTGHMRPMPVWRSLITKPAGDAQ